MSVEWSKSNGVAVCEERGEVVDRILSLGEDDKGYRGKEQILVVDDGDVNANLEEVGEVFREELGELKGYVHKIRMKQGTVAVKHKVRKVPIVVREEYRGSRPGPDVSMGKLGPRSHYSKDSA
ncbi:hypothetical protein NDU88_000989 [Pleurodeles waltl]|uniref:Uncharacterized protein n=1 Tax=Pleurodeles waltl TaxID=8319 RepID=A0AAV7WK64_PLEWA|nr:hypothetical protein NDU88_000989 [Pleurodeles waltl]